MIPFETRSFAVSRWVALTESLRSKVPSVVLSGAYTKKRWRLGEPSASVDILREVICGTIPRRKQRKEFMVSFVNVVTVKCRSRARCMPPKLHNYKLKTVEPNYYLDLAPCLPVVQRT